MTAVIESGRIKASPLARRLALDAGIDLPAVTGTGHGGRIVRRDIESAIKVRRVVDDAHVSGAPTSTVRSDIFAKQEISVSQLMDLRRVLSGEHETQISLRALLFKAVASASEGDRETPPNGPLNRFPGIRAERLLVLDPVDGDVRDMGWHHNPSVAEISEALDRESMSTRPKTRVAGFSILVADLAGAGVSEYRYPRPPDIELSVSFGAVEDRVVVTPQGIGIRKMLTCSVTADSEMVSLLEVCGWLRALQLHVEHPTTAFPRKVR